MLKFITKVKFYNVYAVYIILEKILSLLQNIVKHAFSYLSNLIIFLSKIIRTTVDFVTFHT